MRRVALVIPCHNDGELVREAVESVAEPEPVDIIVVDDGSTDPRSIAVVDSLASDGVHVIRQRNAGPSSARMAGVHSTDASYVFCLDADDLLEERALADLADVLDRRSDAAFAFGDFRFFGRYEMRVPLPEFDPWTVIYRDFWGGNAHLYRRADLLDVGGWSFGAGYEGWDLLMTFAERGKTGIHVHRVVYARRSHGPRREDASRARHKELYGQLKLRHPALFEQEHELRRRAKPPLFRRVTYPLLLGARPLPMSLYRVATRMKRAYHGVRDRLARGPSTR